VIRKFTAIATIVLWASHAQALTDDQLLDALQQKAFDYFWNEANPANGLIKDRNQSGSPGSIASMGFGLSAICIGIDHGWVTRPAGQARVLTTLQTLWNGPQAGTVAGNIGFKGLYYHFLDMTTATRTWDCELSTIDTALLFAGVIDCKQYFSTADPIDVQVRTLADQIYQRADWEFMRNFGAGLYMGWKPGGNGFLNFGRWVGYNEAMILYILALGSPTHPIPANNWTTWTSGYSWQTWYGYSYVNFPPLFGHQYSHCWVDFRYIKDPYMTAHGITYWENSRRATLAQRAYCIANPAGRVGYGADTWGITASDTPTGYRARGAPPAQNDDGTITPSAIGGSIAFAPSVCISALQNLYNTYGATTWSTYGFKDAFNPTSNWVDPDYIGIDQGPIIIMIENFRTQSVWNRFMQNADIQVGLTRAGFVAATTVGVEPTTDLGPAVLQQSYPNPLQAAGWIPFRLARQGRVVLSVYDAAGRRMQTVLDGTRGPGPHVVPFDTSRLQSGVYFYEMKVDGKSSKRQFTVVK